jgi:hypothetical protein
MHALKEEERVADPAIMGQNLAAEKQNPVSQAITSGKTPVFRHLSQ